MVVGRKRNYIITNKSHKRKLVDLNYKFHYSRHSHYEWRE